MAGSGLTSTRKITVETWKRVFEWREKGEDHPYVKEYRDSAEEKARWLISDEIGLGIKFRARTAWHFLQYRRRPRPFKFDDLDALIASNPAAKGTPPVERHLTPKIPTGTANFSSAIAAIIRVTYDEAKTDWRDPPTFETFKAIFETAHFTGPNAVASFEDWLRRGSIAPKSHYRVAGPAGLDATLDQEAMRRIGKFLCESDLRPIQIVSCDVHPPVLSELAMQLEDGIPNLVSLKKDHRPYAYFRCGRWKDEPPVTLPLLVAQLDAFYANENIESAKAITNPHDYHEAVQRIRAKMMQHPAILVFDGHRSPRGQQTALPSLIGDDGLASLFRELMTPRLDTPESRLDVGRFYETRILVLSDTPDARLSPLQSDAAITVEPPSRSAIVARIEFTREDWGNPKTLLELCEKDWIVGSFVNISMLRLVDCWLTVKGQAEEQIRELTGLIERGVKTVAENLNDYLRAKDPEAFLLLRWIALAESEIRSETLARLLLRWRRLDSRRGERSRKRLRNALTPKAIADYLVRFKSILTVGPDEHVVGIDDSKLPPIGRIELDSEAKDAHSDSVVSARLSYSFATNEICGNFIKYGRPSSADEARTSPDNALEAQRLILYRLLAEEALQQEAAIMRHAPKHGALEIRQYRRLAEGLHYGFASLPKDTSAFDQSLRHVSRSLPIDPRRAFDRLYLVFFRHIVQAAPAYEMTRNLGRPAIAAELLMCALWAGVPMPPDNRTEALPERGTSPYLRLIGSEAGSASPSPGFVDFYISLARNLLQADRLNLARDVINRAKAEFDELPSSRKRAALSALAKVELDLTILETDPKSGTDARERYTNAVLHHAAVAKNIFDVLMRSRSIAQRLARRLRAIGPVSDVYAIYKLHAGIKRGIDKLIAKNLEKVDPHQDADVTAETASYEKDSRLVLERAADFISRHAETLAIEADTIDKPGFPKGQSIAGFLKAWSAFYLADRLRQKHFDLHPLRRDFLPAPHNERVFIRTTIKLHAHFKSAALDGGVDLPDPKGGNKTEPNHIPADVCKGLAQFFAYQAQKSLDMLSRFQFRFAAERPSVLMMEATLARTYHDDPQAALALLEQSDDLACTSVDRPRLACRLALERAKALRRLSRTTPDSEDAHKSLVSAALETLRLFALLDARDDAARSGLWRFIARRQAEAVRALINDQEAMLDSSDDKRKKDELSGLRKHLEDAMDR